MRSIPPIRTVLPVNLWHFTVSSILPSVNWIFRYYWCDNPFVWNSSSRNRIIKPENTHTQWTRCHWTTKTNVLNVRNKDITIQVVIYFKQKKNNKEHALLIWIENTACCWFFFLTGYNNNRFQIVIICRKIDHYKREPLHQILPHIKSIKTIYKSKHKAYYSMALSPFNTTHNIWRRRHSHHAYQASAPHTHGPFNGWTSICAYFVGVF